VLRGGKTLSFRLPTGPGILGIFTDDRVGDK
jgi:hypothetical protein